MKKIIFLSLALLSLLYTQAQQLPNRYIDEITTSVQVTNDVIFSNNIPTVRTTNLFGNRFANEASYGEVSTTLKMDIYRPSNDQLTQRPVIIFAFGGGFVNGNRKEGSMIELCKSFARRGFVTATIDYRLGMNVGDTELAKRAVYRALQDGRSAVRYFRKNANSYGVDPNQIYISGHSAGAVLSYHVAYLDKDSERPTSTRDYFGRPDLSGLDAIGDNKTYNNGSLVSGKANGIMGFAGAVGELGYIENSVEIPGVYFHSSDDGTVPFNSGEPFSNLNWIPGINLPIVYGSNQMNTRANTVNAKHTFYPYTNRGHRVHANGSSIYPDIIANGSQYFHNNLLKPAITTISGDVDVCSNCPSQTYTATNDQAYYYDWQITGGTFIDRDPYSNSVAIKWNANTSNRNLTVTPYSRQLARGSSYSLYPSSDNCNWQQTIGLGTDIGAGSGKVYVVGTNKNIFRWDNGNWTQLPGINVRRVDVQGGGHPWVIGTNNRIYRNIGNGWERIRGAAWDIGASGSHIYHMGRNNSVYKYSGNNSWTRIPGRRVKRMDAAPNGDIWAIGMDNHVYQHQNSGWTAKKGSFRASDITVIEGSNTIWAIELETGVPHKYLGSGLWERFTGVLTSISGNSNGELWGTNSATGIYRNNCSNNKANAISDKLENSISANFKVYPNPASDVVNLDVSSYSGKEIKATLVNFLGQKVHTVAFQKSHGQQVSIDISQFKTGIYILTAQVEGQSPISKRVLIK